MINYVAQQNETFDLISLRFAGDEYSAFDIMLANPAYSGIVAFKGGERLVIPDIKPKQDSGIPPWRVSL